MNMNDYREEYMRYRRVKVCGGCYFFTVNLADRRQSILVDEIDLLRDVINTVKRRHRFHLDAMAILPDHLQMMMTLPVNDDQYAVRMSLIKAGFSRCLPKKESIHSSRQLKGERGIWQRRYWEHLIRDDFDYEQHVNYIHYNPVKHGYVNKAVDWPYSTIHDFIDKGILSIDWGGEDIDFKDMPFGE